MLALAALADPVRREIVELLAAGEAGAGEIAERFPVSRPAVSRHLRVLRVAGLVRDELRGREREYRLDLAPLDELVGFVDELRADAAGWERRFLALETEVHRVKHRRRREPRAMSVDPATKETA